MKQRQRFESWHQLLFSTLLLLAMGMTLTACSNDEDEQEQEVSYWDESYPELIIEELVDIPAYVDTIETRTNGAYTKILFSRYHPYDADSLDVAISSNFNPFLTRIVLVETAKLEKYNIPLHSKVYITASVTNRHWNIVDPGFSIDLPFKAYLHKIRIRK